MAKLCLLFVIFSIVTPFIYATFGGYGKVEQSDDKAIDNEYVTREEVDMGEDMEEELPVLWRGHIVSVTIANVRRDMSAVKDMAKIMEDMVRKIQ